VLARQTLIGSGRRPHHTHALGWQWQGTRWAATAGSHHHLLCFEQGLHRRCLAGVQHGRELGGGLMEHPGKVVLRDREEGEEGEGGEKREEVERCAPWSRARRHQPKQPHSPERQWTRST